MNEKIKTALKPSAGKFESFARVVICVLMLMAMGTLTMAAFLHTTGMEIVGEGQGVDTIVIRIREGVESVIYYNDNIILNVIVLALCIAICFIALPLLKKIPLWAELAFIAVWTIVLGSVWVNSAMLAPSEDSWYVTNAGLCFAHNDFSPLQDRYFQNFPFQLGYVFMNEIFIRIAELFKPVERLIFLEIINVIFLAAAYVGIILINSKIFKDQRVRKLTVLLLTFSVQPIIFSTFLYGIIPGLAFAVWALYLEILYLQTSKIRYGIPSVICIVLAVMIKLNYSIVLVAMVAIAVVMMFRRKKFIHDIAYIVLVAALAIAVNPMVKAMYENRSGIEFGDSIPTISWIAMGMNDSDLAPAPGWYDFVSTVGKFSENNYDAKSAAKVSSDFVKQRLSYFNKHSQYANDFFYNKFVSQWNETSYQSIWNNQVRLQYEEKGSLAKWVCGDGQVITKLYMDYYAQLIFTAVLVGIAAVLRRKNFLAVTFPLVILGGVMYHMIAEAKSQYAMPYFILMVGFAAYGIFVIYDAIAHKLNGKGNLLSKVFVLPDVKETDSQDNADLSDALEETQSMNTINTQKRSDE